MSAYSLCAGCGALLACPDCDRALVAVAEGHYECFHCAYRTSLFPSCSTCHSKTFRTLGMGTQRVERVVRRLYPHARILRVDGHAMRGAHAATDAVRAFALGQADILIGTQMALKDWRSDRLDVVGILDADALLSIPDLYADERLYGMIAAGGAAVTHGRRAGTVYVQTYHPSYHVFGYAAHLDYDRFRRATLADRKALRYPPYWRVVKVVFRHKTAEGAAALAAQWHTRLNALAGDRLLVGDPAPPLLSRIRGLCRHQILLRAAAPRADSPLPTALIDLLTVLPPRTIVDIDPVSLV